RRSSDLAVSHANRIVAIGTDGGSGSGRGARLNAVRRPETHVVQTGADGIAIAGMPVQAREAEVLVGLSWNQPEVARQNGMDCGALRRSGWGAAADETLGSGVDDAGAADAGHHGKI